MGHYLIFVLFWCSAAAVWVQTASSRLVTAKAWLRNLLSRKDGMVDGLYIMGGKTGENKFVTEEKDESQVKITDAH